MSYLPAINATLNGIAVVLLLTGYYFIRKGRRDRHRVCMISAVTCSVLFLTSYLIYHAHVGITYFQGPDWARTLYFAILWTHTPLAILNLPLVIIAVKRAIKQEHEAHRRIVRFTFPVWLYVSVTGVLVYFMLYHWFPSAQ